MRRGAWLLVASLGACSGPAPAPSTPENRPNVVLMMADDLGWGDVGFNGNAVIRTPHLDALAADGMRFARFYAQSPVCSPTRGSCLTGRHPFRYGIFGANVGHLPATEPNLAALLAGHGYATGHFGKWHLGTLTADYSGKAGRRPAENHMDPGRAGFETWFSTEHAVATCDPYDPQNAHGSYDVRNLYWADGVNVADGEAAGLVGDDSRIVMDRALAFVRAAHAEQRPFFAVIWFHAPHEPVVAEPVHRALYAAHTEDEQHYYGCITAMDEQVGRLVSTLRELGARDDTLIAFCSDNGPEGNPGPRGRSRGSSGPFRGRKRSLYEGGVRVPSLFVWPGRIPAGASTDFPASTSDYVPTVLDLLGVERTGGGALDGRSLRDVLAGKQAERERPIAFQTRAQQTLSGARFKLVHNLRAERPAHDDGRTSFAEWELYDLLEDPGETRDVLARHPGTAAEMRAALERFVASCDASLAAPVRDGPDLDLAERAAVVRAGVKAPALGLMLLRPGSEPEIAVAGVRLADGDDAVARDDRWHWGSITKSMTATLVARLVEREVVRWEDTVGERLGEAVPDMRGEYRAVNFLHLLSHRGGLQPNISMQHFGGFGQDPEDPMADRLAYVRLALAQEPVGPKEATFEYSNNGFIVAGAMLEAATGESWETLMRREVFAPLGMESAGFGAPSGDQPRGHVKGADGPQPAPPSSDNPAALGPAGRVHMSLADMARYLDAHARERDDFLDGESYAALHGAPFGGNYALGWVATSPSAGWHNGSNTMWYAEVAFDRESGICAAVAVNDGDRARVRAPVTALLRGLMEDQSSGSQPSSSSATRSFARRLMWKSNQ